MSVFRSGDKWRAEVFLKGKRVASRAGFDLKREADSWHEMTKAALKNGKPQSAATFEELLEHFRKWHLPKVRPGTKRRYEVDLKERIEPFFRFMRLAEITPAMIEEFGSQCQKTLKPKSVNNCTHTLRLMLNKAVKLRMLEESPYSLDSLSIPEVAYPWWDDAQDIAKFLEAARASRYYPVYLLALETGMRYGEIAGLSPADIDLERGTIHVHRQWNEREGCYAPTKHGKERWVDVSPAGELAMVLALLVRSSRGDRLFTTATGAPITKSGVAHKYFKACIRRAGVPEICFHGLRHTFASWYLKTHDNVSDLQAILGHSNITTTMRYAHQSARARRKPLDLASITHGSLTRDSERRVTGGDDREKRWRDGRDSNPHAPKNATAS